MERFEEFSIANSPSCFLQAGGKVHNKVEIHCIQANMQDNVVATLLSHWHLGKVY